MSMIDVQATVSGILERKALLERKAFWDLQEALTGSEAYLDNGAGVGER